MDTKAQKLKAIVKGVAPKSTFGTNPLDPWSTKAGISESSLLDRYLSSRGINPKFVSKDQKVSHSKSNDFMKWAKDHQFQDVQTEGITTEPAITSQKKTEFKKSTQAHKEIKTPHGPGSQNEEIKKPKMSALDKWRKDASERAKKHDTIAKNSGGMTSAIDRLQKHLNKEEFVSEAPMSAAMRLQRAMNREREKSERSRRLGNEVMDKIKKDMNAKKDTHDKGSQTPMLTPEDVGDAKAAVHADGLTTSVDQMQSEKKKAMSKSARIIKSLYKKHAMKEELYDGEKEDKSVATYGKKPKFDKADPKDSQGEKKPQAAAVMSGGTTLTGEPRDTIEIDPAMRNRPGQPDVTKKDDKDKKKEEKK